MREGAGVRKAMWRGLVMLAGVTFGALVFGHLPASGQELKVNRDRGQVMLRTLKDEIRKNYYDPAFHGLDLETRFKEAGEKVGQAESLGQIFAIVAQAVLELNDSHTRFFPPSRPVRLEYGWVMRAVGDKCFVVAVRPGSDAAAKGLKPGDVILSMDRYRPNREILWKVQYLYYSLRPQPEVKLVVQSPGESPREVIVAAKVTETKRVVDMTDDAGTDFWQMIREAENEARVNAHHYTELGEDALVWKMPAFDLGRDGVNDLIQKARKRRALVVDMRGNPGGAVDVLLQVTGRLFENDVKVADVKGRQPAKPMTAHGAHNDAFTGKVVALVDSASASSAEVLARVLQLEKRGVVIGDRTRGAVMRSQRRTYSMGVDRMVFWSASITDADVIMSDGVSLEGRGVTPDELILPSPEDLAAGRDPALARAFQIAGLEMTPEKAGAMFPIEWER